ncbi:MAG: GNAT family N-acetyltransferase [Deltaproteobacteria bacterium]|nr:GNAT family N-acetyltransferase [Deltaproteobacteria bacterium]
MQAIRTPTAERVPPAMPPAVELVDDAAWNRMTSDQSPLADIEWIRCHANAFGGAVQLHRVRRDGRLVAGVPLIRDDGFSRVWVTQDSEHCPYRPISGELTREEARELLDHLLADAEGVVLRRLPVASPSCDALRAAAADLGLPIALVHGEPGDARIALDGRPPPRRFAKDLDRQRRLLERHGALELAVVTSPGVELVSSLDEAFELETLGWEGRGGAPICADGSTLRFYAELAHALAARGRFALYTLRLGGKLIAFEYTLRGGGHIELLKYSFDPAYASHSPGQLLRILILERETALGRVHAYHLGRPSPWKQRWATDVAPLCTLRIYAATPRGRAAHIIGSVRSRVNAALAR